MSAPSQTPELANSVAGHSFAPAPGSAWKYLVKHISGGPMPERELNKYGEDGWELCGIASTLRPALSMANGWPDVMAYTFKRRHSPNEKGQR